VPIALDDVLRDCASCLGEPDAAGTERAWERAREARGLSGRAPAAAPERRRHVRPIWARRRLVVLAAAALVAGGGGVAVTSQFRDANPPGSVIRVVGPDVRATIDADPVLSKAPWILQIGGPPRVQDVDALPSLVFPAGTTYAQAVQALYTSVAATGRLPAGTRLGPPLETGKVVAMPADRSHGLALDLRAPFGYVVPGGQILPPSYSLPGSLTPAELRGRLAEAYRMHLALPRGAIVDPTQLRPCMIARVGGAPPCRLTPSPG
jgi:hypothetical protein